MKLHYREYGDKGPYRCSILLLHGLLGSSANWHGIARRLEAGFFHVVSPDLRNHGRSPHGESMDYPSMVADLLHLLDHLGLQRAHCVGHSMGAKAAMWLALNHSERVQGLVSVDMAPTRYPHGFDTVMEALDAVPLDSLTGRVEADAALAARLESPGLRGYLLQNLVKDGTRWRWRMNLPALRSNMAHLVGFPPVPPGRQFLGDSLFLYGGRSDYVNPERGAAIRGLFPYARLRMIPQAGHWVYSDAPDAFFDALNGFLTGID